MRVTGFCEYLLVPDVRRGRALCITPCVKEWAAESSSEVEIVVGARPNPVCRIGHVGPPGVPFRGLRSASPSARRADRDRLDFLSFVTVIIRITSLKAAKSLRAGSLDHLIHLRCARFDLEFGSIAARLIAVDRDRRVVLFLLVT